MKTDRELIAEAIAAGRVQRVPMGVSGLWHPNGHSKWSATGHPVDENGKRIKGRKARLPQFAKPRPSARVVHANARRDAMVADYEAGMSTVEIAARYGVARDTVRTYAHRAFKAGLISRSPSMTQPKTLERRETVIALWKAGEMTMRTIADHLKVSRKTVEGILKRARENGLIEARTDWRNRRTERAA